MTSVLTREVKNIQNPALGAGLIWRFVCGYKENHVVHNGTPLPLLFLVLPVAFHEQTEEMVRGTQQASGLRVFAAKFGKTENSKQDLLLAIHNRMLALRQLTFESIRQGVAARLIYLDAATVIPLTETPAVSGIPTDIKKLMKSSEKLGAWFSQLTMHEIASILKVRF